MEIPLHVLQQVSKYLDNLDVYFNNKSQQNELIVGTFHAVSDPPA